MCDYILTVRQLDVLDGLSFHEGDKQSVARCLGISEHTLDRHLNKIYPVMDVTNMLGSILKAHRSNQLDIMNSKHICPEDRMTINFNKQEK